MPSDRHHQKLQPASRIPRRQPTTHHGTFQREVSCGTPQGARAGIYAGVFAESSVLAVLEAAKYSAVELLRDGHRIEIRALRPDDQADLAAAVGRTSAHLYRRFLGVKRDFSDREIAFFVNVDFTDHVALVAVVEEEGRRMIIGGGRYIVVRPGTAELAFAVIDEYQGRGIGAALMRRGGDVTNAAVASSAE
jgi:GNAT superfamily N-acetyltransferase